ncbi:MAG: hypothetical protein V3W18_11075 [candidate division Zixibacteria bacterium]
MTKVKFHLITISLILSFISFLFCDTSQNEQSLQQLIEQNSTHNVNRFILDKFEDNRIVMLADAGHGESLYLQRVISFLNFWVDQIEHPIIENIKVPHNIAMILETDSISINMINKFFNSGDILDVIEFGYMVSEKFTTAKIEFYFDLGQLKTRIDKYNSENTESEKISLRLFGPEKPIDTANWSFQKRSDFFLYERDEYSSDRIIGFLDDNPDTRALIFYGAAHLKRGEALKRSGEVEATGFYLAHYLNEYFGDTDGVYTINQIRPSSWKHYPHISEGPDSTYIFDNSFLKNTRFNEENAYDFTDATITIIEGREPSRPLRWIPSERIVEFILNDIGKYTNVDNDYYPYYLSSAFQYLSMVSGEKFELFDKRNREQAEALVKQWRAWYDTAEFEIVKDIESLALWEHLLDLMTEAEGNFVNYYELSIAKTLGIKPRYDTTSNKAMRGKFYRDYILKYRERIVIDNLIHLLWIGSDREKEQALDILRKTTGEKYTTAKEWMVWWRGSFTKKRR